MRLRESSGPRRLRQVPFFSDHPPPAAHWWGPWAARVINRALLSSGRAGDAVLIPDRSIPTAPPPEAGPEPAPALPAARAVLRKRLRVVRRRVGKLDKASPGDPERVHDLRIACRRAEAALAAVRPWIGDKAARRAAKALREIRRAASHARRADVHADLFRKLVEQCEGDRLAAATYVLASIEGERDRVYQTLADDIDTRALKRVRPGRVAAKLHAAEAAPATRAELARHAAAAALHEVHRAHAANLGDPERLHEFRLSVKALRYTLGLFRRSFDPVAYDALSEHLADLQTRLGAVNDLREMAERCAALTDIESHPEPLARALSGLSDEIAARRHAAHAEFLCHWCHHAPALLEEVAALCADEPPHTERPLVLRTEDPAQTAAG